MSGFLIDTNVLSEYNRTGRRWYMVSTIVTRNLRDFRGTRTFTIDPWESL